LLVLACWMMYQRFGCIGMLNGMVRAVWFYWRA